MNILETIFIILLALEIMCYLTCGGFVNKTYSMHLINKIKNEDIRLSTFNSGTLVLGNIYVHKLPFSLLCKYYISDIGIVPRYTKLHNKINDYYFIALTNENK